MRYLLVAAVIGSALLPAAAEAGMPYVPLNVRPTVSLTVGQARMFTPAEAPTGAVIACVATGLRVEERVPSTTAASHTVFGWRKGGPSIQLTVSRRSRIAIKAVCARSS